MVGWHGYLPAKSSRGLGFVVASPARASGQTRVPTFTGFEAFTQGTSREGAHREPRDRGPRCGGAGGRGYDLSVGVTLKIIRFLMNTLFPSLSVHSGFWRALDEREVGQRQSGTNSRPLPR